MGYSLYMNWFSRRNSAINNRTEPKIWVQVLYLAMIFWYQYLSSREILCLGNGCQELDTEPNTCEWNRLGMTWPIATFRQLCKDLHRSCLSLKITCAMGTPLRMTNNTPRKVKMEHKHGGGWKMIFLFNWVIFRFQPLIFRGQNNFWTKTSLSSNNFWS